jgi:hypothetical protein
LSISISEILPDRVVDFQNVASVFAGSASMRDLFKLLSDAQSYEVPLQYKYLSVYKIFELEFRSRGRWVGLAEVLARYDKEYKALNVSQRSFENLLHELRDKCAHIKSSKDEIYALDLDSPDAALVSRVLPLLLRVAAEHISAKQTHFKLVFVGTDGPTVTHAPMPPPAAASS